LDPDAVDLVVDVDALVLPLRARAGDAFDRLEPLGVRVRAEAVLAEPRKALAVRREFEAVAGADAVDPDGERPLGGDRRVLLPERSGRSVARVRSHLLVRPRQALV